MVQHIKQKLKNNSLKLKEHTFVKCLQVIWYFDEAIVLKTSSYFTQNNLVLFVMILFNKIYFFTTCSYTSS